MRLLDFNRLIENTELREGKIKEQIKMAIVRGAKSKQTEGFLASFMYLKVAYKKIGENCYKIKTVFIN